MSFELETARLTLKPVGQDDFDAFYKILTDEFVRRYLCDDELLPRGVIGEFIADSETSFAASGWGLWLLREKETGETIGFAGLRRFFEESQPQLLYALLPQFTGRGLASEASRKVIEYAFSRLGFEYLDASCDAPNLDSQRTAERLGMKRIGEETKNGLPTIFYRLKNEK